MKNNIEFLEKYGEVIKMATQFQHQILIMANYLNILENLGMVKNSYSKLEHFKSTDCNDHIYNIYCNLGYSKDSYIKDLAMKVAVKKENAITVDLLTKYNSKDEISETIIFDWSNEENCLIAIDNLESLEDYLMDFMPIEILKNKEFENMFGNIVNFGG